MKGGAKLQAGLYRVKLTEKDGVVLEYVPSLGYFVAPGDNSGLARAFVVDKRGETVVVDVPQMTGDPDDVLKACFATPWPRPSRRDNFWSKVARLRNSGQPFAHMFDGPRRPQVKTAERKAAA